MVEKQTHTVRFEPVGVEMEVEQGETVLEAAFRQGVSLMHGCKEGQCSSCKALLMEGDIELGKYSTFALADYERETGHVLLCRTFAYSDLVVELLNYDEDLLSRSIPVKEYNAELTSIEPLTNDIRLLRLELDSPLRFWAGQYVDITIPEAGITRSFSMANPPNGGTGLEFIIKQYPNGAFSSLLDGGLKSGDRLRAKGPYGTCFRREGRPGPMLLIGGGSGMSPLWSMLRDHVQSGEQRPIRFFYGARTKRDLFYLDAFQALEQSLPDFRFIPALSQHDGIEAWDGETGFVHEVLGRYLRASPLDGEPDAYTCGPPPMIEGARRRLISLGVNPGLIYAERFVAS